MADAVKTCLTTYCVTAHELHQLNAEHNEQAKESRAARNDTRKQLIAALQQADSGTAIQIPGGDGFVRLKEKKIQNRVTPECIIRATNEADLSSGVQSEMVDAICNAIREERRGVRTTLCRTGPPRDRNCIVSDPDLAASASAFVAADNALQAHARTLRVAKQTLKDKMNLLENDVKKYFTDNKVTSRKVTFSNDDAPPSVYYLRSKQSKQKGRAGVEHIRAAVTAAVASLSGVAAGMDDATLRSRLADVIGTELDRCVPRKEDTRLSLDRGRETR